MQGEIGRQDRPYQSPELNRYSMPSPHTCQKHRGGVRTGHKKKRKEEPRLSTPAKRCARPATQRLTATPNCR